MKNFNHDCTEWKWTTRELKGLLSCVKMTWWFCVECDQPKERNQDGVE